MRKSIALSLLALSIVAPAVFAQSPDFEWSKSEAAGTLVAVHNINGNITVLPGTGSTVSVSAHRTGDDDVYTTVKEFSGTVVVCVLFRDADSSCDEDGSHVHSHGWNSHDHGHMDVTVHLPASMRIQAGSVSGDVRIDGARGDVQASTVSGDIRMTDLNATAVHANSVSGDVNATITALSGDGTLHVTSVSGDLNVKVASLGGTGDLNFRSVSGDVALTMPTALDADFHLSTVSGDLDTDYPLTLNGRIGRRSIDARIGKGGRPFRISTVSGDVALHTAQ